MFLWRGLFWYLFCWAKQDHQMRGDKRWLTGSNSFATSAKVCVSESKRKAKQSKWALTWRPEGEKWRNTQTLDTNELCRKEVEEKSVCVCSVAKTQLGNAASSVRLSSLTKASNRAKITHRRFAGWLLRSRGERRRKCQWVGSAGCCCCLGNERRDPTWDEARRC